MSSFFSIPCRWGQLYHQAQQTLALINLEQLDEAAVLPLLSAEEQQYVHGLAYPKRRREWLGGRLAAKLALLHPVDRANFPRLAPCLSILPDSLGRPCLQGSSQALSLSHSAAYAVALTAATACGVDLQKISPKINKLVERFAQAHEVALLTKHLPTQPIEQRLTMLWAAKEALKKSILSHQPSLFAGITLIKITALESSLWCFFCTVQGSIAQTVLVHDFSPYLLAVTVNL